MLRPLFGISLVFAILSAPIGLLAQAPPEGPTPTGPEFQVNTTTEGAQRNADIAMAADGRAFVVWQSQNPFGGEVDIFGQRYSANGNANGGEFQITGDGAEPAVSLTTGGAAMVVWLGSLGFSTPEDPQRGVVARRFDPMGATLGEELLVPGSDTADRPPDVAHAPDDSAVVVWAGHDGIWLHRFAADGSPLGAASTVNPTITMDDMVKGPRLAMAADGRFIVAWDDLFGAVCGRRYDASGTALGDSFCVDSLPEGGKDAVIGIDADSSFFMLWVETMDTIRGQRWDSSGNPVGGPFLVTAVTDGTYTRIDDITQNVNGTFVLAISVGDDFQPGPDGSVTTTMALEVDRTGAAVGSAFQVNADQTLGPQWAEAVARDPEGTFTVVFTGLGQDVFARRYGSAAPSHPDPVGSWPLDEGTGSLAADASGNGLDGVLESGAAWGPGQQGTGGLLGGGSSLIRISDSGTGSSIDITDALTIALWMLPLELDRAAQILVSKDDSYELGLNRLGLARWDLRLANQTAVVATTPLEEGVWQHLAVTWNGSTACAYYNGLLDGCAPFTGLLVPNDLDLGLGARPTALVGGGPVFHFWGGLDNVRIFDLPFPEFAIAELVLAEITDIVPPVRSNLAPTSSLPAGTTTATISLTTDEPADCRYDTRADTNFDDMSGELFVAPGSVHRADVPVGTGSSYTFHVRCRDLLGNLDGDDATIAFGVGDSDLCQGLLGDWQLDDGVGCTAVDGTGTNPAALGPSCPGNAPVWTSGFGGGQALAFDGVDDSLGVASPSGLSSLDQLTLAAWIRHGPSGIFRSIIDRRDSGVDGFDLYLSAASRAFVRINDQVLEGTTAVADGQWHHVAATWDGSAIRLYVDGQLDASVSIPATSVETSGALFLGQRFDTLQNPYAGTLDRVSIHDRGLSAIEVLDLYTAGLPVCTP